jgi:cobalt-zinc-cadmium efflux system membrane fusion protein
MKNSSLFITSACLAALLPLTACKKEFNPADGAPPSPKVVQTGDMSLVSVDKPEQFPLIAAEQRDAASELTATGSVLPDINREVPVISMANGRVVDIKTRLDDNVKKGQLLLKVQSPDITNAFDTYLKAANDEQLTNKAFVRAEDLFTHGAISQAMLEQAEDTEKDAKADLTATEEQLNTLGVDKNHPSSVVNVYAPISGVIVAQNVTNAAAAGVNLSGTATAFTIADLSTVWIVCDVYENDISKVRLGQEAKIKINAWPDHPITGHISDIGPILDPSPASKKKPALSFRRTPCFTCTTAIGSLSPRATSSSSASRSAPARCSTAIARRFSLACSPASRWLLKHSYLKPRGTSR